MMEMSSSTEYTSLREWMLADESLDVSENPLIRLGALYHLGDHYDDGVVIEKLKTLLRAAEENTELNEKNLNILFYLHTAISLANKNDFEGVKWILWTLVTSPDKNKKFAEIALGSCYRFPLATILTLALDLSIQQKDIPLLEELIKYSEDDLIELSQKPIIEQSTHFGTILRHINAVKDLTRKTGLDLGLGFILQRPIQQDIGLTYTGFISVDNAEGDSWVLPYEPGMVINKNNPLLRQNTWEMQASAGRRVIVVYKNNEPYEIKYVYLIPFALLSQVEQENHMTNLLIKGKGADLAVVQRKWSTEKGDFYQWIARNGETKVHNMARKQELGNIFIIHPDNNRPLSTHCSIGLSNFPKVEEVFARTINLDAAVVGGIFRGKDDHLVARIIRNDGVTILRPIDEDVKIGTPVFYRVWIDKDNKEKVDLVYFTKIRIEGACKSCYGVGYVLCPTCHGESFTVCQSCQGTGEVTCSACKGTLNCTICNGTGRYSDTGNTCVKCGGSGRCKYCQKHPGKIRCKAPGCEYGRVKCLTCQGNRVVECECSGNQKGRFVEI